MPTPSRMKGLRGWFLWSSKSDQTKNHQDQGSSYPNSLRRYPFLRKTSWIRKVLNPYCMFFIIIRDLICCLAKSVVNCSLNLFHGCSCFHSWVVQFVVVRKIKVPNPCVASVCSRHDSIEPLILLILILLRCLDLIGSISELSYQMNSSSILRTTGIDCQCFDSVE